MTASYLSETASFETMLDFLRFAISKANEASLFFGHGTDNAHDDMSLLILRSLHLPYDLHPHLLSAKLTATEKTYLCQQLEKRIMQRIPVPYLIQEAYFCDISLYVDQRVLIPRSPLAELIKQQFSPWIDTMCVTRILDLCTGSGCIAIACCHEFPGVVVDAVDISQDALDVALINQKHFGLEEQLNLIKSDCFQDVPGLTYDIIVSNPPYVGYAEMQDLPAEYRHEPRLALEADDNGMSVVDVILQQAYDYLNENGILVVEVGHSEHEVAQKYPNVPFTWLDFEHGGRGVFILTRQQLKKYIMI